jgi:importin-8
MLSTEIPDPSKIEEAFTIIMTTTNDGIRKEADLYLRNLEKNYPYILVSLLQIF